MRGRRMLLAMLLPIAVVAACVGPRSLQGPVRGRAELTDGAGRDDLVAHLSCQSGNIHGGSHRADQAQRVFRADQRFLFPWAWRGLWPAGCYVELLHPLYRMQHIPLERRFSVDLGAVRMEPWDALLAAHEGVSVADLHRHLFYLRHYYLAAFSGDARARLARYVPTLYAFYERGLDVLPPMDVDRFGSNDDSLATLREIEEAVGYVRPAQQEALFAAAAAGDAPRVRALLREGVDPDVWNAGRAAAIHLAARAGHTEVVLALIDGGADVDRQEFGLGDSALLVALRQGEVGTALALLERGADPTLACRGAAPLTVASRSGQLDAVRALIERGALQRARESQHRDAALTGAAGGGYAEIVRALLAAGVPVDAGLPGWSALMHAARNGKLRTAEILLDAGADLDAVSANGKTALGMAREERHSEMVALLEARGAED